MNGGVKLSTLASAMHPYPTLGFGVSVFDGIYQYAGASTAEEKHQLLMKGTRTARRASIRLM